MAEEERDEFVDITKEKLDNPDTASFLGHVAAAFLKEAGTCTLFIDEYGFVRVANPVHVYLDTQATEEPPTDAEVRFIRPVVGEAKPQWVQMKDGRLWEVAFEREEVLPPPE